MSPDRTSCVPDVSAESGPGGGLRGAGSPTPCLPRQPVARPMGPSSGCTQPLVLPILGCPFCQRCNPTNYIIMTRPVGPGNKAPKRLRGPPPLLSYGLRNPLASQSWGPGACCHPMPLFPSMVWLMGPSYFSPFSGPASLCYWVWGPNIIPAFCGESALAAW